MAKKKTNITYEPLRTIDLRETTLRREHLRSVAYGISVVNMGPRFTTKKRKKGRR